MAIIIVLILVAAVGGFIYWRRRRGRKQKPVKIAEIPESKIEETRAVDLNPPIPSAVAGNKRRGTGHYPAMVICKVDGEDVVDFTTIPEPIGEIYQFDTSCPMHGGGFIVKEMADGELVDYDPRDISVSLEETPEYAWFATHWSDVKPFWNAPAQWWKSTANWYAAGLLVIVFISALVVLGGD